MKGKVHTDFVVLKGIEYDTRDAGHILVIMPEGVKMRLLEMRGSAGIAADRSGASKRRCAWTGTSVRRKVYEYR